MCLNFVDMLQFNFKYGFRPTFPSPLQQDFEVVAARYLLRLEFLNIDIRGMILQLILAWEGGRGALAPLLSEEG